jgi:hypothetical protein
MNIDLFASLSGWRVGPALADMTVLRKKSPSRLGAILCHMTVFFGALKFRHVFIMPNPPILALNFRPVSKASIQKYTS